MKQKYIAPEMEIIEFDAEDVITTSLTDGGTADDFSGNGDIHIP
ncbi:hypothetical protein [Ruminococcus sp.]|nr:hypothetical protein [Ruminococcus sp.]